MTNMRIVKSYTHTVDAPIEKVFPLLCPVREYDWIESWKCNMIFSKSGFAEDNCIFQTDFLLMGKALWVVIRYEQNQTIEFAITCPDTHTEKLNVTTVQNTDNTTTLTWERIYTSITANGNGVIQKLAGEGFVKKMEHLANALNHFCTTGKMLKNGL